MHVTFWGVRGSYPVPGPQTVRYGGHTSCVEVRSDDGNCLILDAGTGLRALGQTLSAEQGDAATWQYHVVLSHVHWDHIQGLPFFQPAYMPGTRISIYALRAAADELRQVIGGITRHEFFPVPLEAVPADFDFHEVTPGKPFEIRPDFEIMPFALNHPFGAVGYRIDCDGTSIAYVSDTAPFNGLLHKRHFLASPEEPSEEDRKVLEAMRADLVRTLRGTDTCIFDTHFLPEEFEKFPHWGHSTPDHALDLVTGCVRRLVLYHHAPSHTDKVMDSIEDTYREKGNERGIQVVVARERMTLAIGRGTDPGVGP